MELIHQAYLHTRILGFNAYFLTQYYAFRTSSL